MKNKFRLVVALSFLFAVSSCNNDNANKMDHSENEQHMQDDHAGHDHGDSDEALVLNDGKKWNMNPEMLVLVQSMEKDINGFSATKLEDYQAFGENLDGRVNELTSSCTMEGQAHDELHKWLMPFIHQIKHLKDAENEADAKESLANLKESLVTFNQYFE
jgi:hypothetical protein